LVLLAATPSRVAAGLRANVKVRATEKAGCFDESRQSPAGDLPALPGRQPESDGHGGKKAELPLVRRAQKPPL